MGTVTKPYAFVAGAVPTAANWNANPDTIINEINGQLDSSNVDTTSADGIVTMDTADQQISGRKDFTGGIDLSGASIRLNAANTTSISTTSTQIDIECGSSDIMHIGTTGASIFTTPQSGTSLYVTDSVSTPSTPPNNALVHFEKSGATNQDCYLAILSDDTGHAGLYLGHSGDPDYVQLEYDHNNDFFSFTVTGTEMFRLDPGAAAPSGLLDRDVGNNITGPIFRIGRNTNGTQASTGCIQFIDVGGDSHYLWVDDTGVLRISATAPTGTTDTSGTVVGTQT
jgi:hypothetical protein